MTQGTLFGDAGGDPREAALVEAYQAQGRTLDDLPHTPEFEAVHVAAGAGVTRAELFHRLHNLRKAGRLPRLGRARTQPPRIEPEQEALLVELTQQAVGVLSRRDQLPYTPAFDDVVDAFNTRTGLSLSHHDIWRIIAKLAK